mgnify:CR=1 FL=1
MAFVYVSNAVSGDIIMLHMAGNGELSLQSPCQLAGSLAPMAISPGKKMLYVAQRGDLNAIVSLAIHSLTGELTQLAVTPLSAKMSYLARDHSGAYLLAASYHSHHISVLSLGVDGLPFGKEHLYETPKHPHSVLMSQCSHTHHRRKLMQRRWVRIISFQLRAKASITSTASTLI